MTLTKDGAGPSRRAVMAGLGLGALGLAGAGSALTLSWAGPPFARKRSWWNAIYPSLRHGAVREWSRLVGERFAFAGEEGTSVYTLRSVTALPSPGRRPREVSRKQAFAVTFQSDAAGTALAGDRMVEVKHPTHAAFPIYLGPAVREGQRTLLTAIFN